MSSEFDTATWESIPWLDPFAKSSNGSSDKIRCKHAIPYVPNATRLQNLELYIPTHRFDSDNKPQSAQPGDRSSKQPPVWIIFIHGGAWRDPRVTSRSFEPTLASLLANPSYADDIQPRIAGFASLNYRLSQPMASVGDPARHPDGKMHISDVNNAVAFLQTYFFSQTWFLNPSSGGPKPTPPPSTAAHEDFILVGHSCGATLSFQTVKPWLRTPTPGPGPALTPQSPVAIVGVSGLYDLDALVTSAGRAHAWVVPMYREFLTQAFGPAPWALYSATHGEDGKGLGETWAGGRVAVLAQSRGDSLVPWDQTDRMEACLRREWEASGRLVRVLEVQGDHNDVWDRGFGLAGVISKTLKLLEEVADG